jgi:hypothetical protein
MAYTFVHDVPGNARIYAQVNARIGEDMPPEFIAQVVHTLPDGLRHIEVWESRDAWERFQSERVAPAVDAVLATLGITPRRESGEVPVAAYELVDVRVAATARRTPSATNRPDRRVPDPIRNREAPLRGRA